MPVVTVITGTTAFESLADEWRVLLADSGADPLFMSWDWLYTWWRCLGGDRALRLLEVRDGARLIGLAPLVVRGPALLRLQPFEVVEFLGTGTAGSDYLDVIAARGREADVLDALVAHFAATRTALEFSHAAPGALVALLAASLADRGWATVAQPVEVCPHIQLSGHDWDSYLGTLGAAHRYNVRRRFRNLAKSFDVRFERAQDDTGRRAFLADLVRLHRLRRESLGGSDGLGDDRMVAFHEAFTARAQRAGWLRLYRLVLDGDVVAAVYGCAVGDKFYFYQSGFDPAFGRHSVGLLILAHSIRDALEEGLAEYDLLHGNEAYKYQWAVHERPLVRHHLYPPRLHGAVAHRLFGLKQQLKTCRVA